MTADAILAATIPSVLPTLMVLTGILLNKNDINQVRTSISELRGEMGAIRAEINALRTQFHNDIQILTGLYHDVDKRVSRLEDKS